MNNFRKEVFIDGVKFVPEVLPVSEPVKERINVAVDRGGVDCQLIVTTTMDKISKDKYPLIKKAIEFVLNDYNEQLRYSQSEVDAIRKETWLNARYKSGCCFRFDSFEDYLSSINLNTNDEKELQDFHKKEYGIEPEQPTNDNAFVWTDELVLLLCVFLSNMESFFCDMEFL